MRESHESRRWFRLRVRRPVRLCGGRWLAPYELTGDVDVVALLEGLRNDGAVAKRTWMEGIAVLYGFFLRIVEPALRKRAAHKLDGLQHRRPKAGR